MAKSKYHYYVLVITNEGPKYVTEILENNWCKWNEEDAPYEMSASFAEDVYIGLCANLNYALLIKSRVKISHHPYRYEEFNLKFIKKGEPKK